MGTPDTNLGGAQRHFPPTRWTVIRQAREESEDRRGALDQLCRLYWKPIYAYIRASRAKANEEAKDLTQEFLIELIEGNLLSRYSPERGTFRAYLQGALHLFLLEAHRKAGAKKRGGGRKFFTLDDGEVDRVNTIVEDGVQPDEIFDRQWANSVIDNAVGDLRTELVDDGKEPTFQVFDRYELNPSPDNPPTHASVAAGLGLKESEVNHALSFCRGRLRELIVARVREYTDGEKEVQSEVSRLFQS